MHKPFKACDSEIFKAWITSYDKDDANLHITPQQFMWKPMQFPAEGTKKTFIEGITSMGGAGGPALKDGVSIMVYACNANMEKEAFYSSDGDMLIVPQEGAILVKTEFGKMRVEPLEICVVQRGITFSVELIEGKSRGFIAETYKGHFALPELGPIGANGMANPRDFEYPVAWYEDVQEPWTVVNKFQGKFFYLQKDHSPFDIVAWHGNYAPYKYDLRKFNAIGSISFDHPDPSSFTVLTAQSDEAGQAVCDFVIFPPRWMVAENTFRPPYYHRNTMNEFMGAITKS